MGKHKDICADDIKAYCIKSNKIKSCSGEFTNLISSNSNVSNILETNNIKINNNISFDNCNVRIGTNAGNTSQFPEAIAIGCYAGEFTQGSSAIAIGIEAGNLSQRVDSIAIGNEAGKSIQGTNSIAIGNSAAKFNQNTNCISIGLNAGYSNQSGNAIAIGANSGKIDQGIYSVALGYTAGEIKQGTNSIAIGIGAGYNVQLNNSIAIGNDAANLSQSLNAIAIGNAAGLNNQSGYSVAIGFNAGYSSQGSYAIAIGYRSGYTGQHNNSIIINATNGILNSITQSSCYINPIRTNNNTSANLLAYDTTTKEVFNSEKTFVIDHPIEESKYLVHACLEGPEAGVYYRGVSEITNDSHVIVKLPDYVDKISNNFTIHLTQIYNGIITQLSYSEVENNEFTVYGRNTKFSYIVYGTRNQINVEPRKDQVKLNGSGPYRWISLNSYM